MPLAGPKCRQIHPQRAPLLGFNITTSKPSRRRARIPATGVEAELQQRRQEKLTEEAGQRVRKEKVNDIEQKCVVSCLCFVMQLIVQVLVCEAFDGVAMCVLDQTIVGVFFFR